MKTLLDLIQEYAALNEAKTLSRGVLPPQQEARWSELKRFYDMLMAQDGLARDPAARYTPAQIRERVATRERLRVQTDLEIVVAKGGEFQRASVGNLSCGGVLLYCDHPFEVDDRLTLHMANPSRGDSVFPTEGRIVWRADLSETGGSFRFRFGVQFLGLGEVETRSLDAFIVDSIETKLLCLGRDSLDPIFLKREQVTL